MCARPSANSDSRQRLNAPPSSRGRPASGSALRGGTSITACAASRRSSIVRPCAGHSAPCASASRRCSSWPSAIESRATSCWLPASSVAVAMEGARIVSASGEGNGDSPADAFIRTVIDGAAQYEHGLIRARTTAALAAKRARGERVGSVPFGFALHADGVRLVANLRERATIARARRLRARGLSLRAVAARLADEGCVSRTARRFTAEQVARMLSRRARQFLTAAVPRSRVAELSAGRRSSAVEAPSAVTYRSVCDNPRS
jgi:hypothetical protein